MNELKPMTYEELVAEYRKLGIENATLRASVTEAEKVGQRKACEKLTTADLHDMVNALRWVRSFLGNLPSDGDRRDRLYSAIGLLLQRVDHHERPGSQKE